MAAKLAQLDTLRNDDGNPHAVKLFARMSDDVFARMSDDAIRKAIAVVTRIPDHLIRQAIVDGGGSSALADKMIARKGDMARWLGA